MRESLKDLSERYGDLLIADGFDDAIIGVGERAGCEPVLCYDRSACIQILMDGGQSFEEAEEYFEFNVVGAWVGELTPIFITTKESD
ncbi:hypothetical protein UFOVP1304_6 [uncultured Caudovirales phage]|uniref:Uncharacterized protein n=1 Tax=uncultured Caudovirales phage TaxID=2100421 RepID=A0A6J5RM64_9CAUD|nr:hypothetical protein UFOVP1304_6 [uncultured Caudovirales phage]